jgi:hypothetical protein
MGLGSGIRDPRSGIRKKTIPDPGVKKAPDPGSGPATLVISIHNFRSSSGSGSVIYYGSGSGSTSQKVTVPTVPVPAPQHRNEYSTNKL